MGAQSDSSAERRKERMTYKKLTGRLVILVGLFVGSALLVNCGEDGGDLDLSDPTTVLQIQAEALPIESLTPNQDCVAFTASGRPYTGWAVENDSVTSYLYYFEGGQMIRDLRHSDGVRQKQRSYSWNGKRAVVTWEWPDGQEAPVPPGLAGSTRRECVDGRIQAR